MLEKILSKEEYVKQFSRRHSKAIISAQTNNPSYADKVKTKDTKDFVTKKKNRVNG